jgi:protein TonB
MRPAWRLAVGAIVVAVTAAAVVERGDPIRSARGGRGLEEAARLPGPSALEESGEVAGPLEPSFRPPRAAPRLSAAAPRPRFAAPAVRAPGSDPAAPPSAVGPLEARPAGGMGDAPPPAGADEVASERHPPIAAPPTIEGPSPETSAAPPPGPVLKPPVLLTPQAVYPGEAQTVVVDRSPLTPEIRLSAAQGRVVLRVLVRADGAVAEARVEVSSGHAALDDAALRACYAWRFEPATRDGRPVDAWVLIPVRFLIP